MSGINNKESCTLILQNDFDKFGFYVSNNRKTYSKFEAIEYSTEFQWNFNDDVFSSYDWLKEPIPDINYFYDNRAKQIREKYDYIVLFYSGGFDSHNILKTFYDNNIHIDEVLTNIPSLQIDSTQTIEYRLFTSKKIEKYKKLMPNTVFRFIEYKDILLNELVNQQDILYSLNHRLTVNHFAKSNYKKTIPEHKSMVESGKNICYIFGIDKPVISMHKGIYYSRFSDLQLANVVLPEIQFNRIDDIKYEFFYWSPDCVPLLIKQAHVAKGYYKNKPKIQNFHNYDYDEQHYNYVIYPRCVNDNEFGYFYEKQYQTAFKRLNAKRNVYEIAGSGGRDSWIHDLNHPVVKRTYEPLSFIQKNFKQAFRENNTHSHLKIGVKYYNIGE